MICGLLEVTGIDYRAVKSRCSAVSLGFMGFSSSTAIHWLVA